MNGKFFVKRLIVVFILVGLSYLPAIHLFVVFNSSFGIETRSYVDYGFLGLPTAIFAMALMLFLWFFLFVQDKTIRVMESIERRVGLVFFVVSLSVLVCLFSWPVRIVFLERIEGFVECKELRSSGRRMSHRTYAIDGAECLRLVQARRGL